LDFGFFGVREGTSKGKLGNGSGSSTAATSTTTTATTTTTTATTTESERRWGNFKGSGRLAFGEFNSKTESKSGGLVNFMRQSIKS